LDQFQMPSQPVDETRRSFPIILVGIVATVLFAACLGVYLASSVDGTHERVTREVAPPPKGLLPLDAAIASGLVGGKACQECHPGESALHSLSGHARTLHRKPAKEIISWLDGKSFPDREYPKAVWTYSVSKSGRLQIERDEPGQSDCYTLDYALGSGVNGMTFVSLSRTASDPGQLTGLEQRLSYFAHGPRMDISPGQAKQDAAALKVKVVPQGRPMNHEDLVKCFNCHSTVTSTRASDQFDPDTMIPNISCERCHGPGRSHIAAARRGGTEEELAMPLGSSISATPLRQLEVCGECHRRIEDVASSVPLNAENRSIVRFEPVGLGLSLCFQRGKGELSCTKCHDPHARVSRDHAAYEAVCLSCHSLVQEKHHSCPISPSTQCLDCHMPRRVVPPDFLFTDHWIRTPKREPGKTTAN
jgi:hypothetical protein